MATFVLVHGAWHGGWCWDTVRRSLLDNGHRVTAPTLTGLAERKYLLSAETGMEVFADDIVSHIRRHDFDDVILVGHSFGGNVVTVVADRLADRLQRLVILDGDIAQNGCSTFDLMPSAVKEDRLANLIDVDGIACMPPPPGKALGIDDADLAASVAARLTPHPVKSYQDIVALQRPPGAGLPGDFIRCRKPDFRMMEKSEALARTLNFRHRDIAAGHDVMVTDPGLLSELLARIADIPN